MFSKRVCCNFLVLLSLIICSTPLFVHASEKVSLQWKVPETGLFYKTDMSQINPEESFIKIDFDKLDSDKDSSKTLEKEISKLKLPDNMNMVSILENTVDGNIKTTSYLQNWQMPEGMTGNKDEKNEELEKFTKLMNSQPQLEGVIDSKGEVVSFYLPQSQKNLLALMYELPDHPVQIGDSWHINMYCIHMGGGFLAEKAKRINHVELKDITIDDDGNSVAVIDYTHTEIVSGTMLNPMTQKKVPTEMTCSYIGRHEFYLNKGYWKSINGEMSIQSEGVMESKTKQRMAMLPISELPSGINHK